MVGLLSRLETGELMSVSAMQELGLPRSFMVKIAKDLIKVGIMGAKEGRGGGYYLMREANKILVSDVVEALEGEVTTAECVSKDCPMEGVCPHKDGMKRLSDELSTVLAKYSVAELGK